MYANDIALIRIVDDRQQGPRDPARIHPIPLFEGKVAPGAEVTGTGWGKTEAVEGHAPSAVLMKVDLRAMDTEVCKSRPAFGSERIHGKVICASHPQRSTCQGDSGGALTFTNGAPKVVGVVSWGKKRCTRRRPARRLHAGRKLPGVDQAGDAARSVEERAAVERIGTYRNKSAAGDMRRQRSVIG